MKDIPLHTPVLPLGLSGDCIDGTGPLSSLSAEAEREAFSPACASAERTNTGCLGSNGHPDLQWQVLVSGCIIRQAMTRMKIESGKESAWFIFSQPLRNTWEFLLACHSSLPGQTFLPTNSLFKDLETVPQPVAARNKEEGVDSHPKSCLLSVLQKLSSPEAGHQGCQGDLKYRFVTILNKSAPRAQRGEGVSHSKPSVAQILKWGNKNQKTNHKQNKTNKKNAEQRKVWLRDVQAEELRHAGSLQEM